MAVRELVEIIKENPFKTSLPYEKLVGNLAGKYSPINTSREKQVRLSLFIKIYFICSTPY